MSGMSSEHKFLVSIVLVETNTQLQAESKLNEDEVLIHLRIVG